MQFISRLLAENTPLILFTVHHPFNSDEKCGRDGRGWKGVLARQLEEVRKAVEALERGDWSKEGNMEVVLNLRTDTWLRATSKTLALGRSRSDA